MAAANAPHVLAEKIGQCIFRRPTYDNLAIGGAKAITIAFGAFRPLAWIVTRLRNSGVQSGFENRP